MDARTRNPKKITDMNSCDNFEPWEAPEPGKTRYAVEKPTGVRLKTVESRLVREVTEYLEGQQSHEIGYIFSHVEKLCKQYTMGGSKNVHRRNFICDVQAKHNSEIDQYNATEIQLFCLNRNMSILTIRYI